MRPRSTDSDYLRRTPASTWATTLISPVQVGTTDLSDTDYLYIGKGYWDDSGDQFSLWRTWLRAEPTIPPSHEVASAYIRLYIASDADTDFTLYHSLLAATYGTVTKADWGISGGTPVGTSTATAKVDAKTKTLSSGQMCIDLALDSTQLAEVVSGATLDFKLYASDETTEPTDLERLKVYSHQYATAALRPHLCIITYCHRERIERAFVTTLERIKEVDGYSTTPALVTRDDVDFGNLGEDKLPALCIIADEETREAFPCEIGQATWQFHVVGVLWYDEDDCPREFINRLSDDVDRILGSYPTLDLDGAICHHAWLSRLEGNPGLLTDDHRAYCLFTVSVSHTRHLTEG